MKKKVAVVYNIGIYILCSSKSRVSGYLVMSLSYVPTSDSEATLAASRPMSLSVAAASNDGEGRGEGSRGADNNSEGTNGLAEVC